MADLKISALNSLAGADLVAADVVAVVDDSASETKKLTVSDLIANGTTLISDATIPSAKILFSAGAIDTAELAASAVETAKINDSAVTAAKLADNSSVTLVSTLPASGDFTGQIALDTDDDKIYVWDGSAWDSVKGAGSINVVNGSTSGIVNITTSTSGDTVTVSTTLDDTTAAAQFLGGPTGSAGTVGYRALVGTDLPTATTTAKGGIIVNGEGLRMDSDTIEIDNDITANSSTFQAVKFDSKGLITSGRDITSADLPDATDGATGAVKPGTGLEMGTAGAIDHSNSVAAATNTKITYDAQGHVTAGTTLAASDIPDLDTAKVTTGSFATARIADDAITAAKLGDRSTATIAETTPAGGAFIGQTHLNSITGDYFLWDGNVWQPIGISVGEIILAGTYDASTNLMATVTSEGTALSFEVGSALPAASSSNKGYYVVVSEAGTGTSPAPTVALNPPDFLLSTGTAYTEIDVSSTVTAQQASNVAFTAAGNIAATNVQSAIEELDTEKVAAASPSLTGTVSIGTGGTIEFEGATANDFETTLTVTDPTADRTITLPDVTGTVVTTGDTGSVTSTMITDGTIVNADINASAEIAVSKLANGTARQLLQTDAAGTGVEFTSNVDVPGTFDCTGAGTFDSTLTVTGLISADGKVSFPAGTASAPSFYFGTDTNTGLYHSAADEVAITTGGTQRVVIDSSGNVGIGLASPSYLLDVYTQSNDIAQFSGINGGSLLVRNSSSNLISLNAQTGDSLTFGTNGNNERLRIDTDGRLLLGTSAARATGGSQNRYLQVEGTTYASAGISLTCNSTSNSPGFNFGRSRGTSVGSSTAVQDGDDLGYISWSAADGTDLVSYAAYVYAQIDGTAGSNNTPGRLIFSTTAPGNAAPAERMRIDSSGRVGIKNSSMGSLYEGADDLVIGNGGASNQGMTIYTGASNQGILAFADGFTGGAQQYAGYVLYGHSDDHMQFATAGQERIRVDSSGRVGINNSSPGANLDIYTSASRYVRAFPSSGLADFEVLSNNNSQTVFAVKGTGSADLFRVFADTTQAVTIDSSGRLGIGTTGPAHKLDVDAGSLAVVANFDTTATGGGAAYFKHDGANKMIVGTAGSSALTGSSVNDGLIRTEANLIVATGGNTERLRIDSSGNLKLSSDAPFLYLSDNDNNWIRGSSSLNAILVGTNNSEKLRVDSSGRLLLGTTTEGNSFADNLTIADSGSSGLTIRSGTSSYGSIHFSDATSGTGEYAGYMEYRHSDNVLAFGTSSTERLRITSSGVVTVRNSSVGEIDALTSASTITPDFAASNNFSVTLGTNATLANPSNLTAGQSGVIAITQDGTGSRTLAYGSKFKFAGGTAPTLTTTASAVDILTYYVESTSRITAQVLLNVS